jgi:hypothetical protein
MNAAGWAIMLLSIGGTTAFLAWCIVRVFREKDAERKLHGRLDIETPDKED